MSERKSAEIKFRCTPSFKAGVQAAATAADQTLTEYVEAAVWAHQNARLVDTALAVVTADELREAGHPNPKLGEGLSKLGFETRPGHTWDAQGLQPLDAPADGAPAPSPQIPAVAEEYLIESILVLAHEGHPVAKITNITDDADCSCRPWEYCTHKST